MVEKGKMNGSDLLGDVYQHIWLIVCLIHTRQAFAGDQDKITSDQ